MVRILYYRPDTVDCTADPHIVSYEDREKTMQDVLTVLESELMHGILWINVYGKKMGSYREDNEVIFVTDEYSDWAGSFSEKGKRKLATGEYAEKHKVAGLYFVKDAEKEIAESCPNARSLGIGLTAFKNLMKYIEQGRVSLETISSISIAIMWKFSMGHSCSDYITVDFEDMTVDYSNQDSYTGYDNYREHCSKLGNLLGVYIEPYNW